MPAPPSPFAAFVFALALIAAAVIDLRRGVIPDEITFGGTAFALLAAIASSWPDWREGLLTPLAGLAAGLLASLALYAFGNAVFKKQIRKAREADPGIDAALGWGDVKFMAFIGAFLGPSGAWFVLFGGSVLAAVIGTAVKFATGSPEGETGLTGVASRWRTGDAAIPFGPFLAAAGLGRLFFEYFGGQAKFY